MLRIEIDIPRPLETLFTIVGIGAVVAWLLWGGTSGRQGVRAQVTSSASSQVERPFANWERGGGGPDRQARAIEVRDAVSDAQRLRQEQAVLGRREEILRYQLNVLEHESLSLGVSGPEEIQRQIREAEQRLVELIDNQRSAETQLLATLRQMWEAEGISATVAVGNHGGVRVLWPVEPTEGLSAGFLDEAYEERFGIPHHAIDIPVSQGSDIRAAADGTVEKIVDNGLGYSYVILKHKGFTSLYGHVSATYVKEGDTVRQGDVVAASGGRPGTRGAGALTTGPHLHFEIGIDGAQVDPLTALPERPDAVLPESSAS
ncbi:MAG: peptidoglycan DD-metalloendopeptidase family protein [Candidatus Peribacteraceae bacterium]|nr:peptidoglycan DD-metalloendopeptidase family protein [Candidatus Peribacteraceae bacterium]MDD5075009.1 peptidoglycan DD-metalloendopeptidase family protein [Candidatus Peribacteraceae bacterium]